MLYTGDPDERFMIEEAGNTGALEILHDCVDVVHGRMAVLSGFCRSGGVSARDRNRLDRGHTFPGVSCSISHEHFAVRSQGYATGPD